MIFTIRTYLSYQIPIQPTLTITVLHRHHIIFKTKQTYLQVALLGGNLLCGVEITANEP